MSSDWENGTRIVAYGTELLVLVAFNLVGMIDEIGAAVRSS